MIFVDVNDDRENTEKERFPAVCSKSDTSGSRRTSVIGRFDVH